MGTNIERGRQTNRLTGVNKCRNSGWHCWAGAQNIPAVSRATELRWRGSAECWGGAINIRRVDICTASRVLFVFHENGFDLGNAFRRGKSAC